MELTERQKQSVKLAVRADIDHARKLLGCDPIDAIFSPSWDQINDAFHTLAHAVRRQGYLDGLEPCCTIERSRECSS